MVKHWYKVKGVVSTGDKSGLAFEGTCVAYDIISAIQMFRDNGFSVHIVPCREHMNAKNRNRNRKYTLYAEMSGGVI